MDNKEHHFLRRFGFGNRLQNQKNGHGFNSETSLARGASVKPIEVLAKPHVDASSFQNRSAEDLKEIIQKNKEESVQLNAAWTQQMTRQEVSIREKMTFFWHDHFACRARIAWLAQQQNNTVRTHALGFFTDLLMSVSKDPAMIQFLNNQQNKKDSPNENFAREVMELFTLGRGHYTEEDVKQAARAFTGWAFDPRTGAFIFRPRVHDQGVKNFRGQRGNFTGEDIIDFLLSDKQTTRYITEKIWTFFVSNEVKDEEILESLSAQFYSSNYDIYQLVKTIASSDWFYESRFVGNRIKSPIELLIGIQLHTQGTFSDTASWAFLQRAMGQILFFPPHVGGWPIGKEWIDSSSLTFRLSLPGILLRGERTDLQVKDDGDVNNLSNQMGTPKFSFAVNWEPVAQHFVAANSLTTLQQIESFLLARPTHSENRTLIEKYTASARNDLEFVQRGYIGFMSLPEYQLN